MLTNERYAGRIIWGRFEKAYRGGTKVRVKRPECDWIRIDVPDLAIIDPELWEAVEKRFAKNTRQHGRGARKGAQPKYLLSGLARCTECGGPISVEQVNFGPRIAKVYACSYNRKRGKSVCKNSIRRPVAEIDDVVIDWFRKHVLQEAFIVEAIRGLRRRLDARKDTMGPDLTKLETEAKKLEREMGNLAEAIASMGHSEALTDKLAEREARLTRIQAEMEATRIAPDVINLETRRMEHEARERIDQFREMLSLNPKQARAVIDELMEEPLQFEPFRDERGPGYRISGEVKPDTLCTIVDVPKGI